MNEADIFAGDEDYDDLQQCECIHGCQAEAYDLCNHCLRWLCPACQDAQHHGCEVSIDEQYRQHDEARRLLAKQGVRGHG